MMPDHNEATREEGRTAQTTDLSSTATLSVQRQYKRKTTECWKLTAEGPEGTVISSDSSAA